MNNAFLKTFQTLQQVYNDKAFSSLALNRTLANCKAKDRALITKLVYGVLDEDIHLTYLLSKFVKKMPKDPVLTILKMGTYCLLRLSVPVYAVVNDLAELAKVTEDRRQVGFVNATLKRISAELAAFDDYPQDEVEALSVKYSYPEWALKKLVKDFGMDTARQIVCNKIDEKTTVRVVGLTKQQAAEKFGNAEATVFDDAFAVSGRLPEPDSTFTAQSLSSMAIARAVAAGLHGKFLDCCSAPGGKAVYVKQLRPDVEVTACDIHPHRVELINSYAKRMGVDIKTHCADMTRPVEKWLGNFDAVLCDVPCSGFGVLDTRPDIKLFRENKDISDLMKLQYAILSNCSSYVKPGGRLIYSTCTVFDNENGQNIRKFLKEHPDFAPSPMQIDGLPQTNGASSYQFLPHKDGMQGFFLAVLQRK